jgi:glycosyltransferase involved in cell wall biosynthesis
MRGDTNCSIIVTTRNSARTIRQVLQSATRQTLPAELIVVDNFSFDGTPDIAKAFGAKVVLAGDERSRQRNEGVSNSTGDWLLFVDADMVMSPDLVLSCVMECQKAQADAAIVPQFAEGHGFLAKARAFEKSCYVDDDLLEAPRFFSRQLFESIGGYDPNLVAAEDWDIAARARASSAVTVRTEGRLVHLDGHIGLGEVFRKMQYYSPSLLAYKAKHPALASRQMSPLRAAWWRHWARLMRRPILFAGIVLLKVTELAGFIVGIVKLKSSRRLRAMTGGP